MDCERNPSLAPLLKHSNNMKPTNKLLLALCVLLTTTAIFAQTNLFPTTGSAGIGTTDPNPSALLDMVSTSKGILVPRMTKVQRDAIASPATGFIGRISESYFALIMSNQFESKQSFQN